MKKWVREQIDHPPEVMAGEDRNADSADRYAPRTADECRLRISKEVMTKSRPLLLRNLWRLLKSFEKAEQLVRDDVRTAALRDQNMLSAEANALAAAEYRRRFVGAPKGQQDLLRRCSKLEKANEMLTRENAALSRHVIELESGRVA